MSSPRAQAAVERLYENTNVRDELTDDEADALLAWAEAELSRLDRADLDDDAYAAQVDTLLGLLKQVNRYAGRQGQAAAQGVDAAPAKIAELAGALGHSAEPQQVAAAGTGDPAGTISALTALFTNQGGKAAAASAEAQPALPSASPPPPAQKPTGETSEASPPPDSSNKSPSKALRRLPTLPNPLQRSDPDGKAKPETSPPDDDASARPLIPKPTDPSALLPSGDDIVDL